jgi:hypothetical protein
VQIDEADRSPRTAADLSPVDHAGVQQVIEFERAAGRHPQLMPHDNPGFDVVSRDDTGRTLRHIEIKSTARAWDDMGVGLSRTQFQFGQQHRETFWLYVVEHALDPDRARILRIADPTGRAEEFRFDDGWSAVSEGAAIDPEPPTGPRHTATPPGLGWVPMRTLRDDLTAAAQPEEWIHWPDVTEVPGSYAVQVLGHALEPDIAAGDLVILEPIAGQPQDGEVVVVQLRSGLDRDGNAAATVRHWVTPAADETTHAGLVALNGAAGTTVPPLYVDPSTIVICGRVVASRPNGARPGPDGDAPTSHPAASERG